MSLDTARALLPAREERKFEEILSAARELGGDLRDRADDIDDQRRLPPMVVQMLKDAGIFRMTMPRAWGGPELTSLQQIEVIEALGRGSASTAWCAMIGCDSGLYSAWLDDSTAREMYPRLDMVQAGWVFPAGRAVRAAGGYQVSGRWMFGSGCQHADWLAAGCWVYRDAAEASSGGPSEEWRVMLARPEAFEILDTWHSTGLRGTGSTDYRCVDLFVPAEHSFSFFDRPRRSGTLYAGNEAFLRKLAGIPLGMTRAAIDDAVAVLEGKVDRTFDTPYREMPRIHSVVADAEGRLGAARAFVFDSVYRLWDRLERGDTPSKRERAHVWLARLDAFQTARWVARSLYDLIGGEAVYAHRTPFDRYLRDAETMCQHVCGQSRGLETVGAMLFDPAGASLQPFLNAQTGRRRHRS